MDDPRNPGDLQYHYRREDRLKLASSEVREKRARGFLKGNRGLVILLLDIAIIVILYGLYMYFFREEPWKTEQYGYSMTLRAFSFEDEVFVSLGVEKRTPPSAEDRSTISFMFFPDDPEGPAVTPVDGELLDILPDEEGESRIYRFRIPVDRQPERLYTRISLDDAAVELNAVVSRE